MTWVLENHIFLKNPEKKLFSCPIHLFSLLNLPLPFVQVEKTRHLLLLREKLGDAAPVGPAPTTKSLSELLSPSMSSGSLSTSTSISSQISSTTFESAITPSESSGYDSADIESLVDREKELATKVQAKVILWDAADEDSLYCLGISGKLLLLFCCSRDTILFLL